MAELMNKNEAILYC